jgi:hypothetical protein
MFAQISDTVTLPPSVALNVANLGGGTLAWTADASPNWINITPTQVAQAIVANADLVGGNTG